jgi:hypothetical protein
MTSIVLTVPLCLTIFLLSMVPILLPPTNLSLITEDTASKQNIHLKLVLVIEKQSCRLLLFLNNAILSRICMLYIYIYHPIPAE